MAIKASRFKHMNSKKEFQSWLETMPSRLKEWLQELPTSLRAKLDYTPESVVPLEAWFLENFAQEDGSLPDDLFPVADIAGYYVGEMLKKYIGGDWTIEIEDQELAYFGVPGISNLKYIPVLPIHPVAWITTSVNRQTGKFLQARVQQELADMEMASLKNSN